MVHRDHRPPRIEVHVQRAGRRVWVCGSKTHSHWTLNERGIAIVRDRLVLINAQDVLKALRFYKVTTVNALEHRFGQITIESSKHDRALDPSPQ